MAILSNVPQYDGPTVTLHSTWLGVLMSYLGAVIFLGFSSVLLLERGPSVVTVGLFAAAVVFAIVAAFDLPIAAEFRRDGVVRRTALRHQFLDWNRVDRLRRLRVGILRIKPDGRGGGLVAAIGVRKYVLVDTMEGRIEFDDLRRVLAERADALELDDVERPSEARNPTWLYRRDRWKPASVRSSSRRRR
jgi:hypothetical protein